MSSDTHKILDRRHVSVGTTLTWQEMDILVEFVDIIHDSAVDVQAGPYNGSFCAISTLAKKE